MDWGARLPVDAHQESPDPHLCHHDLVVPISRTETAGPMDSQQPPYGRAIQANLLLLLGCELHLDENLIESGAIKELATGDNGGDLLSVADVVEGIRTQQH